MSKAYAELIGDPVAHSLSPAIFSHWFGQLDLDYTYRVTRVPQVDLPAYIEARRSNPHWRGCNVTMPLKRAVLASADTRDPQAAGIGAANCLIPDDTGLTAFNTDIDGIAAALRPLPSGQQAVVIGAGGAARAALAVLREAEARVTVLARNPAAATAFEALLANLQIAPLSQAAQFLPTATLIINASPLGMKGAPPMPDDLLQALARTQGALAFDMVYRPAETPFLAAARAARLRTADGLDMLIGQARRAFALFFGIAPPPSDAALKRRLLRAD